MNDPRDAAVERLVPHRGGMLWIDRVLVCEDEDVSVEALIRDDHPFVEDDALPAWIGIEYMAQCIAAWAGGRALRRGGAVKPGFLLGTRRYTSTRPAFAVGLRLRIDAHCELFGDNGLGLFACRIFDGDEEIATANVSVFEPPDADAFLGNPDS